MRFSETQVYLRVKKFLADSNWSVVAGQPPSGSDHLPVIEIKDPLIRSKGSLGSFKPDMLAWRENILLIVELKSMFTLSDVDKLNTILDSEERKSELWDEINSRNLRLRSGENLANFRLNTEIVGGLGYGGDLKRVPGFMHFVVHQERVLEYDLRE